MKLEMLQRSLVILTGNIQNSNKTHSTLPNTLIHIAVQAPISRVVFPKIGIPWILASTLIPDVPWILQRILMSLQIIDIYQVRLYVTVQASLVFCLLLSLAISSFHRRPIPVFFLLAGNSLLHLLLDALQTKWGNGIHLAAPASWHAINFGVVWPEHIIGYALTLLGGVYLAVKMKTIFREGLLLRRIPHWKTAGISLALYLLLPFLFMDQLQLSDTNFLHTLRDTESRAGKKIELDRSFYSKREGTITYFTGEKLPVIGILPEESGTVSLKGEFIDRQTIRSFDFHRHNHFRDYASRTGIFLALAIWLTLLVKKLIQPTTFKGETKMKKSLLLLFVFLLLPSYSPSRAAAEDTHLISMNIPQAVINDALQQILPLTLRGASSSLEGAITIVDISELELHEGRIFCRIDLQGDDLDLITTVADQNIRLKLGSARLDFDSEAELRYEAAQQTLYIKAIAKDVGTDGALQNGDIGNALLLFLNGREFPLALEDIQPVMAEAGSKVITITPHIADIKAVEGALQFSLNPEVTAAEAGKRQ